MKNLHTPWVVQTLSTAWHDYPDWTTYAVRDARNICLAVVGDMDHATAEINGDVARLVQSAPELLAACKAASSYLQCYCGGTSPALLAVERQLCDVIRAVEQPIVACEKIPTTYVCPKCKAEMSRRDLQRESAGWQCPDCNYQTFP